MNRLIRGCALALLALSSAPAFSQTVINSTIQRWTTATTMPAGLAFPSNVTAGDGIVAAFGIYVSGGVASITCSDTQGNSFSVAQEPTTDGQTVALCYGVAGATGADTISVVYPTSAEGWQGVAEVTGLPSMTLDTAATLATGTSALPASNTATPAGANEVAFGFFASQLANLTGSWGNSYVNLGNYSGNGTTGGFSDSVVSASTSTSYALTSSHSWDFGLVIFKAGGGATCTHKGLLSNGTKAIPTSGSTVVWRKDGTFGTVDCMATQYWQPDNGQVFGVN